MKGRRGKKRNRIDEGGRHAVKKQLPRQLAIVCEVKGGLVCEELNFPEFLRRNIKDLN